jgi:hypothetical protein
MRGVCHYCTEAQVKACGGGGTWALTLASLLVGAADRLHEEHGIDRHFIASVFQEALKMARGAARRLMAPLREVSLTTESASAAASAPGDTPVLQEALWEALATIRRGGVGGVGGVGGGVGDSGVSGAETMPGAEGADGRALAALAVGFNRDRHPGDAALVLAASLLLAKRRPNVSGGDDLEVDATRVSFQIMPGLPSSASAVVPGLHFQLEPGNCPGGGGRGSLAGDVGALCAAVVAGPIRRSAATVAADVEEEEEEEVLEYKNAAAHAGLVQWRVLLVDGSVAPLEDRSYTMVVDYEGVDGGGLGFASEADEREEYAARVVDAVNYAGGADIIMASGAFDAVTARALRERAGVAAVLCSVSTREIANASTLAGVRPVMDIEQVIASDVAGGSNAAEEEEEEDTVSTTVRRRKVNGYALSLTVTAEGGWNADSSLLPLSKQRQHMGERPQSFISITRAPSGDDRRRKTTVASAKEEEEEEEEEEERGDVSFPAQSACPVVTVAVCAPVLELAEVGGCTTS